MARIALGTSSWQFDAWRGVFYPQDAKVREYLEYYARKLPTVEVNTTFYAIPRVSTVQRWIASVPEDFSFCLKFPRVITHEKRLVDCEAESRAFLEILRLLGNKQAPAFLQFPPRFTRAEHGRALADYLDWLAIEADGLRLAVEVRSNDLLTPAFAAFLAERGFSLMLVDRVRTPDLFPVWMELIEAGRAPDHVVIRWIGDDKNGPSGDRELSLLRDDDLACWAERIIGLHAANVDVYGYMHNPYEGHSPASVDRLDTLLRQSLEIPIWSPPAPLPLSPSKQSRANSGQLSLFD
jgi:uncharacterized protein YecE (DUF72 family)